MTRTLILALLISMAALALSVRTGLVLRDRLEQMETKMQINANNLKTVKEEWNLRHNEQITFMVEVE